MAKESSPFTQISLHPLTGLLDTRSRPADLPAGAFRYKLNFGVNSDGKFGRRAGHERTFADHLYDSDDMLLSNPEHTGTGSFYHNHDHHKRGLTRKPGIFLYQCQDSDGVRHYFDGTETELSKLNADTGEWTLLASGIGASQARWRGAILQNKVFFTNNVNNVMCYDIDAAALIALPQWTAAFGAAGATGAGIAAAKIVLEFDGVIMAMNLLQDGQRRSSRIQWSDLNDGTAMAVSGDPSVAAYHDLDYGDDIIGAVELQSNLYIFTRSAIWRCTNVGTENGTFSFKRVYCEPKNRAKCLAYEQTLVSTGDEAYYLGIDTAYVFNPYLPAPTRADEGEGRTDWLHRAVGVIYTKLDTKLDANFCASPVAEFVPATRELWISWPSASQNGVNNWSLAANVDRRTADVVDTGYTSFLNQIPNPASGQCNQTQDFWGYSGRDYAIKSIGRVFYREYVTLTDGDVTLDIPEGVYYSEGYNSMVRGLIPTGYYDREKTVDNVLIDDDTVEELVPAVVQLRIANAPRQVDPNDEDNRCAPLWNLIKINTATGLIDAIPLACQNGATISAMKANGLRPDTGIDWPCFEQGIYLFFELTIRAADGGLAIGGDSCWSRIDFNVSAQPKP